jgi:hypothetical protein
MIELILKADERQNGSGERNLTTHSTGALDSVLFIIFPSDVNCVLLARARLIRALDPSFYATKYF